MFSSTVLRSPKSYAFPRKGRTGWYGYYACYSAEFVEDIIAVLDLAAGSTILDPWNGSGTTTLIAHRAGYNAIGFDINPVMVIAAKAQTIAVPSSECSLIQESLIDICQKLDLAHSEDDPLLGWMQPKAARSFRRMVLAVHNSGVQATTSFPIGTLKQMTPTTAFQYLALFRTFRKLVSRFSSSNPTWFKRAADLRKRISPSEATIFGAFLAELADMLMLDGSHTHDPHKSGCVPEISIASSRSLPLPNTSVDAIIASPPYCTRIDYAIATSPELAVLGYSDQQLRQLREMMIGSPTITTRLIEPEPRWGKTCLKFLKRVSTHLAKASSSYYYRNHIQYFEAIYASLAESDRVLKPDGYCVLVVQDSYYKEVHNDLSQIFKEMADSFGWYLRDRKAFTTGRTLAQINAETRKYGSTARRKEHVMIFQKGTNA